MLRGICAGDSVMDDRRNLKQIIAALPDSAGVYLMKDSAGQIIYVGKALDLRKRVRSYFTKRNDSPKIEVLKTKIADIEYIETPTEVEALLLEAHLINECDPRYNTLLKDDKSYPLLKISKEDFPRISITRNNSDKKAVYYGPYTDASLLKEALRLIYAIFPIRKCKKLPKRECLYYHLQQCIAPCINPEVKEEYARYINEIIAFLQGSKKSFIEYLTKRMYEAAKNMRFEEADIFKKQVQALERLKKRKYYIKDPSVGIGLSATAELKKVLSLQKAPGNIVCFDVSNIQGTNAVASRVAFRREVSFKEGYRRYKIKTVKGINDYAMLQEALTRMLKGISEGRENFIPDLIIIDGGKGHLNAALEVLEQSEFANIPCISIAKRFETIYSKDLTTGIVFPEGTAALNLLKRIRDEAHRFAITYHRKLRSKGVLS